jgi:helix-turn-helix protein
MQQNNVIEVKPDLTLQQVSERLNVPVRTLREWMKKDMKCYWQKGHVIRFPVDWLENWVNNRSVKPQRRA